MERLLKTSCQEVLGRTRHMLVRTLAGEGLHVDANMTVSVDASAARLRVRSFYKILSKWTYYCNWVMFFVFLRLS